MGSAAVKNKNNFGILSGVKRFVDVLLLLTELAMLTFYVICASVAIAKDRLPTLNAIVLGITLIYALFYIIQFKKKDRVARDRRLIVKKVYTFIRVSLALAIKLVSASIIIYTAFYKWDGSSIFSVLPSVVAAITTAASVLLSIVDFFLTITIIRQKRRVEAATKRATDKVFSSARNAKNAIDTASGKVLSVFRRKDKVDDAQSRLDAPSDTE